MPLIPLLHQQGTGSVLVHFEQLGAFRPNINWFRTWKVGSQLEARNSCFFQCEPWRHQWACHSTVWRGSRTLAGNQCDPPSWHYCLPALCTALHWLQWFHSELVETQAGSLDGTKVQWIFNGTSSTCWWSISGGSDTGKANWVQVGNQQHR